MKIKKLLITAFISLATSAVMAISDLPISDPHKKIVVDEDTPKFSIKLQSTNSSESTWYLTDWYNHSLIKPLGFKSHVATSDIEGAATYEEFDFELTPDAFKIPQQLHLSFVISKQSHDLIHSFSNPGIMSDFVVDSNGMFNCHFGLRQRFTIETRPSRNTFVERDTSSNSKP